MPPRRKRHYSEVRSDRHRRGLMVGAVGIEDFDPWESLRWKTVRVLFYRQQKPDGEVIEAFWLTDSLEEEVSSRVLYHRAKSRWEIENQGFNSAKNRQDLGHQDTNHPTSLMIV